MDIEHIYKLFLENPVVTTDSRNVPEGSIFFALKGDKFDGNKFAPSAIDLGASYAVISDSNYEIEGRTILVNDTLKTLQELAAYHRQKLQTKIVGITGSNGKTTTKELVLRVLSTKFKTFATQGNFNNHIGVPLTLLSLNNDFQFAVIEMGANHPGEIKELCDIAKPVQGLITNIGRAHLEGFGSIENLIDTKLALFRAVRDNNGYFLLNTNDKYLSSNVVEYGNILKYGEDNNSIVRLKQVFNDLFVKIKVEINGIEYEISTNLIGDYNTDNILAAITIGIVNDIPVDDIISAIESYQPQNNRSQLTQTENNKLVLDMYNANPTSMKASIANFSRIKLENKTLIVGDMLELGENEIEEHQNIVDFINDNNFYKVYLIGKIFGNCNGIEKHSSFGDVGEFIEYIKNNPIKGCSVLIKASNGTGLKNCVPYL